MTFPLRCSLIKHWHSARKYLSWSCRVTAIIETNKTLVVSVLTTEERIDSGKDMFNLIGHFFGDTRRYPDSSRSDFQSDD